MGMASARATGAERALVVERDEHERALVAGIVDGDVSAFARLLDRYWEPLVRYAARRLGGLDAAEDAVQQAFVRLWRNRALLKPNRFVSGYLYRLVHNLAIDELRRRRTRERADLAAQDAAAPPTPAQVLEADELAAAAARAIDALPERRRDVFVMAHFHGLSYRQIAEVLEITPRTVANHMTLALRELRSSLQPLVDRKLGPRRSEDLR